MQLSETDQPSSFTRYFAQLKKILLLPWPMLKQQISSKKDKKLYHMVSFSSEKVYTHNTGNLWVDKVVFILNM